MCKAAPDRHSDLIPTPTCTRECNDAIIPLDQCSFPAIKRTHFTSRSRVATGSRYSRGRLSCHGMLRRRRRSDVWGLCGEGFFAEVRAVSDPIQLSSVVIKCTAKYEQRRTENRALRDASCNFAYYDFAASIIAIQKRNYAGFGDRA
jgi:hypothetical protein